MKLTSTVQPPNSVVVVVAVDDVVTDIVVDCPNASPAERSTALIPNHLVIMPIRDLVCGVGVTVNAYEGTRRVAREALQRSHELHDARALDHACELRMPLLADDLVARLAS